MDRSINLPLIGCPKAEGLDRRAKRPESSQIRRNTTVASDCSGSGSFCVR